MTRMALLVLVLLAPACSDGPPSPAAGVPSGFERYDGTAFSIAHPQGWTVSDGDPVVIEGPADSGVAPRVTVQVGEANPISAAEGLGVVLTRMQVSLDDLAVGDTQPLEVAGARDAAIVDVTFSQEIEGQVHQISELVADVQGPGPTALVIHAAASSASFAEHEQTYRTMLSTLVLDG